ncbi:MAG TPA: hypothetical protein ENI51_10840 [Candidatus Atribacteria bacterium]|nr:hypothetical protein [Candidatus Atribacteria bacterium]
MKNNTNVVCGLSYLEHLIDEIEEYFEYVKEEKIDIGYRTTKILRDVSDMLYKETQQMRRSIGLPHN